LLLRYREPPWVKERSMIIVRDAETDARFGSDPWSRSLEENLRMGYILLDKPRGPRCQEVMDRIRKILGVDKAGYGGTLEPRAGRSRRLWPPAYLSWRLN